MAELQHKEEINDATHEEKIKMLKFYLEQSINPDAMDNIPDDVIKAFIVKVVVHPDSFDWYLRFSPDKTPKSLCVDGKRKSSANISSLCSQQDRLLSAKVRTSNFVKVQELTVDLGQAKAYLYAYPTGHRIQKWNDIHISVFI